MAQHWNVAHGVWCGTGKKCSMPSQCLSIERPSGHFFILCIRPTLKSLIYLKYKKCPGRCNSVGWSPVQFPHRAHAWDAGLVPSWGVCKRQLIDVSLAHPCVCVSLSPVSLPLSLKSISMSLLRMKT